MSGKLTCLNETVQEDNDCCSYHWFFQLVWFYAAHKKRLTRAERSHQHLQRTLELTAQSGRTLPRLNSLKHTYTQKMTAFHHSKVSMTTCHSDECALTSGRLTRLKRKTFEFRQILHFKEPIAPESKSQSEPRQHLKESTNLPNQT